MPEKMNLVIKDVILEKWKSKIGYSFNYKDLDELEVIISQFNNHIEYLQQQSQQKEDIINKAKEHLELKVIRYSNETDYMLDETDLKEIIEILDNKGE